MPAVNAAVVDFSARAGSQSEHRPLEGIEARYGDGGRFEDNQDRYVWSVRAGPADRRTDADRATGAAAGSCLSGTCDAARATRRDGDARGIAPAAVVR